MIGPTLVALLTVDIATAFFFPAVVGICSTFGQLGALSFFRRQR